LSSPSFPLGCIFSPSHTFSLVIIHI
jgi:hypothetical protein